jgi:hypothetical protein
MAKGISRLLLCLVLPTHVIWFLQKYEEKNLFVGLGGMQELPGQTVVDGGCGFSTNGTCVFIFAASDSASGAWTRTFATRDIPCRRSMWRHPVAVSQAGRRIQTAAVEHALLEKLRSVMWYCGATHQICNEIKKNRVKKQNPKYTAWHFGTQRENYNVWTC